MLKLKIYGFITTHILIPWLGFAAEFGTNGNWLGFFAVIFAPFIALAIIVIGVITLFRKLTHPRWR